MIRFHPFHPSRLTRVLISRFTVVALELFDNQLTGELPSNLQYLTSLKTLNLDGNDFWGPLPTELWKMTVLETLDLSNNDLSGTVPTEFGRLSSLCKSTIEGFSTYVLIVAHDSSHFQQ
jgi:Leucine-rich repeat (LRR) protein